MKCLVFCIDCARLRIGRLRPSRLFEGSCLHCESCGRIMIPAVSAETMRVKRLSE